MHTWAWEHSWADDWRAIARCMCLLLYTYISYIGTQWWRLTRDITWAQEHMCRRGLRSRHECGAHTLNSCILKSIAHHQLWITHANSSNGSIAHTQQSDRKHNTRSSGKVDEWMLKQDTRCEHAKLALTVRTKTQTRFALPSSQSTFNRAAVDVTDYKIDKLFVRCVCVHACLSVCANMPVLLFGSSFECEADEENGKRSGRMENVWEHFQGVVGKRNRLFCLQCVAAADSTTRDENTSRVFHPKIGHITRFSFEQPNREQPTHTNTHTHTRWCMNVKWVCWVGTFVLFIAPSTRSDSCASRLAWQQNVERRQWAYAGGPLEGNRTNGNHSARTFGVAALVRICVLCLSRLLYSYTHPFESILGNVLRNLCDALL